MFGLTEVAYRVWLALLGVAAAAAPAERPSIGIQVQEDAHPPQPWRTLTLEEQAAFDLGYKVFNTEWVPANTPAGRIDGLGPLFNAQGCDACHNSRRRGRGPVGDGDRPAGLVIQLGRRRQDGTLRRGTAEYGFVLNTAAIAGFVPEARIEVRYRLQPAILPDGTRIELREPHYHVADLSGPALAANTVLMPRLPPSVHGVGLLERVPPAELERIGNAEAAAGIHGRIVWLVQANARVPGRFGWQATGPTVASQTAVAFAREMGLTTPLINIPDCGKADKACLEAPNGGSPEVEPALFDAVVAFESLQAVAAKSLPDGAATGARLFVSAGCAVCHRTSFTVDVAGVSMQIHPYTDLLAHRMGAGLADRDLAGRPVREQWRTAPLWGLNAAYASGQPVYLLHDGRARSVEEAVLWHEQEGHAARERFTRLGATEREALVSWVRSL
jgi:CxxC motif-containing protein (DUF1111 family)